MKEGAAAVMDEHLAAQLEDVLAAHFGTRRRVRDVARRPSAWRSSFVIDEIDVELDDGTTVGLIAKATDREALSSDARRAKPSFLWDEEREHATYESILSPLGIGSPQYFGSYVNAAGIKYLLLERLAGVPLWQCGELEAWRAAARWLARMHVRVGVEAVTASGAAAHLLRYDRGFYDSWAQRASRFHEGSPRWSSALVDRHARVVDWLLGESPAFIHGEFYSANILVDRRDGDVVFTVRPVDWEMAALGPPLVDLACLVAGRWSDDQRADMADTYYLEVGAQAGDVPPRDHYLKTLDCCLFHLAITNLGWSDAWTPPPDHAHDWLGDALRLGEKWHL